ncbi:MAG: porin [Ketobacteraceae bacterium]|nr:porin [Ketobacteraceae bacterium]
MVKPTFKYALLPLAICISSGSVFAATNAELERRLEAQDKEIKKLERKLKGTRGAVKQNRNRISDLSDRFRINGFFTGGFAVNDGDDAELAIYGIDDNYSTAAVSRLGLQMTFEVTKDMNMTGQLVARGVNDYEVEAEWAYLSWNVTSDFTARIGRQRIPYYLLSEYLEVGYAYPWVRPPIELYNIPISSTDGIGLLYDFNFGDLSFSTQGYVGAGSGFADQLEGEFTLNQAWGVAQFVEWKDFTFRVGYNTSNLDVGNIVDGGVGDNLISGVEASVSLIASRGATMQVLLGGEVAPPLSPLPLENIDTQYTSAAMSYDNGSLMVIAEIANLKVDDFIQPAGDGGYLTVAYRFGDWMPHFTYAKFYTDSDSDSEVDELLPGLSYAGRGAAELVTAGADPDTVSGAQVTALANGIPELYNQLVLLKQEQTSYTLGVTYNINPRVKAKLEATHYENMGTVTLFDGSKAGGNGRFSGDPGAIDGHTAIYSFSIDAVF